MLIPKRLSKLNANQYPISTTSWSKTRPGFVYNHVLARACSSAPQEIVAHSDAMSWWSCQICCIFSWDFTKQTKTKAHGKPEITRTVGTTACLRWRSVVIVRHNGARLHAISHSWHGTWDRGQNTLTCIDTYTLTNITTVMKSKQSSSIAIGLFSSRPHHERFKVQTLLHAPCFTKQHL